MATGPVVQSEWDADYERRKAAEQTGWRRGTMTWDLTRFNSKSFDDRPDVQPIYECSTCHGKGYTMRGAV